MKPESKGQRQKRCQNEKTDPRMPKKVGDRLRKKIISLFLDETEGDQSKEGSQEGEKTEIWLFLQQPQQEKTENQDEGKRRRSRRESQPVGKSGIPDLIAVEGEGNLQAAGLKEQRTGERIFRECPCKKDKGAVPCGTAPSL